MHLDEFLKDQSHLLTEFRNIYEQKAKSPKFTRFRPEQQWLSLFQDFIQDQHRIRLRELGAVDDAE